MSDGQTRRDKAADAPLVVVGGGLIGPVLALYLARAGHRVAVYDRRPDPRGATRAGGRSINLTLCERGFRALERVGAAEPLRRLAIPARGRILHQADGTTEVQPYGNRGEAIYSIIRRDIHETLLSLAEAEPGVELFFDHACVEIEGLGADGLDQGDTSDPTRGKAVVTFEHGGRRLRVEAGPIFGCDGAYSVVRSRMQRLDRFDYSQSYVPQGYKELHVPARADGSHRLDPNAIHVWPRGRHMLIGFANRDGSFTLALHLPFEGDVSFASISGAAEGSDAALLALFERDFADVLPLLPDLQQNFRDHPVTSMVTIRCRPWSVGDRVLLVGDSAHAIVPSYGQGANCGFEDCAILADCLAASPGDWGAVFRDFERRRKADADAIAELALEHFDELQVWVGDPTFLRRKAIERRAQALFPDRFQSLYNMVSFTTLSYGEARTRAAEQQGLIDQLLERANGSAGLAPEAADIEGGALDDAIRHAVSQLPTRSDDPTVSPRGERR